MKLTKKDIEKMANEVAAYLRKRGLDDGVRIYYNNKAIDLSVDWRSSESKCVVIEDINPLDYFEWANEKHILSMSFEGGLYDLINYGNGMPSPMEKIFNKYGCYYEYGNYWNLTLSPIEMEYSDIEYTPYEKEPEPEYIFRHSEDAPPELQNIMMAWYELSKKEGDIGSCVIGAGFKFSYKGKKYFMCSCSPWQGSISWERHKDTIEEMLNNIGATDIIYDWGRMD